MGRYAYDIEVLPNLITFVFMSVDEEADPLSFVVYGDRDDRPNLAYWLRETRPTLVGYNNRDYDNLLLVAALRYPQKTPAVFYDLSTRLLSSRNRADTISVYWELYRAASRLDTIDLMQLLGGARVGVRLKEIGGKLGLSVTELDLPFDKPVAPEDVDRVLAYNEIDVSITKALYRAMLPIIDSRTAIGTEFDIPALDTTDSTLANKILERYYGKPSVSSTPRSSVALADIISPRVTFQSPELNAFLEELRSVVLTPDPKSRKYRYSKTVRIADTEYAIGVGGLHSVDAPGIYRASAECSIIDCDVSSYYPSLIINERLVPEHLGEDFLERAYVPMVRSRLEAKAKGDRVKSDGLKIAINATFGKLNSRYFWLEDARAFLGVTINGQLFLLSLAEELELAGIRVISVNTDGLTALLPVELEDVYRAICSAWEERTELELEYTRYERLVRRAVNDYIAVTETGKVKTKGNSFRAPSLTSAHKYPIIASALVAYYTEGVAPLYTLHSADNLLPFCYVYKSGGSLTPTLIRDGSELPLQSVNRIYASVNGGLFQRVDGSRRLTLAKDTLFTVANEPLGAGVPPDINYGYYLNEIKKAIDAIGLLDEAPIAWDSAEYRAVLDGYETIAEYCKARLLSPSTAIYAPSVAYSLPAESGSSGSLLGAPEEPLEGLPTLTPEAVAMLGAVSISVSDTAPVEPDLPTYESRYSVSDIVDATKAFPQKDGYRMQCPVHKGTSSNSLTIREIGGRLHVHCWSGCDPHDIVRELEYMLDNGIEFDKPNRETIGTPVAEYRYTDREGTYLFSKIRYEPKAFRIGRRQDGELIFGLNGQKGVLYHLPEVLSADTVYVVEGEKDVETLRELGFTATCNPEGAGSFYLSYVNDLAEKKIVIVPDRDAPGMAHAKEIIERLVPVAQSVRLLELPSGKDISDYVASLRPNLEPEQIAGRIRELAASAPVYGLELDITTFPLEPGSLVDAWLDVYSDNYRFASGFDNWYQFTGTHWEDIGKRAVRRSLQHFLKTLNRGLRARKRIAKKEEDPEEADRLTPYISLTNRTKSKVAGTEDMLRDYLEVYSADLDSGDFLNLANGLLDVRTRELLPHKRDAFISYCLPYEYDPKARAPVWESFLEEVLVTETLEPDPELILLLQEYLGYCLTTSTIFQKMLWAYGTGANGKSVVIGALRGLLGELAVPVNFHTVGSLGDYQLSRLVGKRVYYSAESEVSAKLREDVIKTLSDGTPITVRPIYGSPLTLKPVGKIIWAMNHDPIVRDNSNAIWRRLLRMPFYREIPEQEQDIHLPEKLGLELPGILNWALDGLERLLHNEAFTESQAVKESVDQLKLESNPVALWVYERASLIATPSLPARLAYEDYSRWAKDTGRYQMTSTRFGKDLKRLKDIVYHGDKRGVFYGLRLNEDDTLL